MWVIRKKLSATEGAPPRTRVNPDTGVVETTPDDGTTWVDDPRSDPRQNPAYILPPPSAPDVKCAAAAGMVENVRRVIDGAAGGTTVAGIATILLTLLLIPGIGWMFAAMLLFASAFVTATSAAVLAAFTEDVYDFLLCSFYANIDADGKVSWEQLEAVQAEAAAEFPNPLVGDILAGIMQMHREVGFTNAGVAYADPDADCSTCTGWAELLDFEIEDYGFTINLSGAIPNGEYIEGVGYRTTFVPTETNGYRVVSISRSCAALVTHFEMRFEYSQGACFGTGDAAAGLWSQSYVNEFYLVFVCDVPTSPGIWNSSDTTGVPVDITQLIAQLIAGAAPDAADPGGVATLKSIRMCGVGTPPGIGVPDDPC